MQKPHIVGLLGVLGRLPGLLSANHNPADQAQTH